jgi:hypothetical protein
MRGVVRTIAGNLKIVVDYGGHMLAKAPMQEVATNSVREQRPNWKQKHSRAAGTGNQVECAKSSRPNPKIVRCVNAAAEQQRSTWRPGRRRIKENSDVVQ